MMMKKKKPLDPNDQVIVSSLHHCCLFTMEYVCPAMNHVIEGIMEGIMEYGMEGIINGIIYGIMEYVIQGIMEW